jgi:hypothetical protein
VTKTITGCPELDAELLDREEARQVGDEEELVEVVAARDVPLIDLLSPEDAAEAAAMVNTDGKPLFPRLAAEHARRMGSGMGLNLGRRAAARA